MPPDFAMRSSYTSPVRQPRREYHTRFGWWLMTHDRGGAAVIGCGALVILAADVAYSSSRWTGAFPRSFLIALGGLAACFVVPLVLRVNNPIGSDRRRARWNQRGANAVFVVLLVAFIEVGNRIGGNDAGVILGSIAGLATGFVLFVGRDVIRNRGRESQI